MSPWTSINAFAHEQKRRHFLGHLVLYHNNNNNNK